MLCRLVMLVATGGSLGLSGVAPARATATEAPASTAEPLPTPDADPSAAESPVSAELLDDWIERRIDAAVASRLASVPRPRYVPATDRSPRLGEFPFSLAISGFIQLRWFEFARSATEWTSATGQVRPISNINTFNLNRFLVSFGGHAVDERLLYNIAIFGTSDGGLRSAVVPIGFGGWRFGKEATLGLGVTQLMVTREWMEPSGWQMGVDRSLANTFFRPGFSPGAFAKGVVSDTLNYQAGIWNGIDGGTLGVLRRGTSMAFAGMTWWEPLAPMGLGYGDMEHHDETAVRIGLGGCYARTQNQLLTGQNPEDTLVRLSDGTALAEPNALGPDTTLTQFQYQLAAVDMGWKRAGWAANFEYYFRVLDGFVGTGVFERSNTFDHGGSAYLSWCFLPRTLEAYARSSVLTGPYGTGQEYGGGLNWYLNRSRQGRLSLEALSINRSAAQNILYPYRAGYTGTAIQTQLMVIF